MKVQQWRHSWHFCHSPTSRRSKINFVSAWSSLNVPSASCCKHTTGCCSGEKNCGMLCGPNVAMVSVRQHLFIDAWNFALVVHSHCGCLVRGCSLYLSKCFLMVPKRQIQIGSFQLKDRWWICRQMWVHRWKSVPLCYYKYRLLN